MKDTLAPQVRFGGFELDVRRAELRNGVGAISLQEQPFQILLMLVERDGEIVTREEIQRKLWPDDTVVEFDQSINAAIKKLRKALGDSADEPRYIRTVAKQGYRLIVPVERVSGNGTAVEFPAAGEATASTGAKKRTYSRWLWLLAAAGAGLAVIAAALYWPSKTHARLTDTDTIVLADFANSTGDPVFDDTLKHALTIQLQQSPFLNILSTRKVRRALKQLNRSAIDPLTENLALEVCRCAASKAVISGSIRALGKEYKVGLKAADCNTHKVLAEAEEQARDRETVIQALDEAALNVRQQLGEPRASVRRYATPSAEATMRSLEAWKALSMGLKASYEQGSTAALPFFERAVEIDPNFAIGYIDLSFAYANRGETQRPKGYARKAYELRGKVSERERLAIESGYYFRITGELEKAAETYERWAQIYPREVIPRGNLAVIYTALGNPRKSLDMSREVVRLDPDAGVAYENLADDYMNLNRLDEAGLALKQAEDRKLTSDGMLPHRYQLAFLQGDTVQMAQIAAAGAGKPGVEDSMWDEQANTEGWHGRFKAARRLTQQAMDSAQHNDAKEAAAEYQASAALCEAAAGNRQQARADATAALKLDRNRIVKGRAALVLALAGDPVAAEKLAGELDQELPVATTTQHYWLPAIRAGVALARKDAPHALELLAGMGALELSPIDHSLYPVYLRGEAYLMLHDGKAAAEEFHKFVEHYGVVRNCPWGALARLGLARAYALEAQTDPAYRETARTAYQNFLTLWKDADPDIPIYKQAKAEYARLH